MPSVFARRLERAEEHATERFRPWNFGIPQLDGVVKGVRPGFTNLIVARPHVGKTLLVLAGIRNNPDVPTLFVSADDDPDVVVRKMMQFDGIIEDGWQASRSMMSEYIERFYPNLDVIDDVTWGPSAHNGKVTLADGIDRFQDAYQVPPGLVVYDYLGIDGNDFAQAVMTASWMKSMTKVLPMPVLTIAQSSRQGAKTVVEDGQKVRRGFRMEDLSYGGEQQAGLMMGLSSATAYVGGMTRPVIEVDVVKNKAVFDGSGITNSLTPIVLCHSSGRLTDRMTVEREFMAGMDNQRREAQEYARSSYFD